MVVLVINEYCANGGQYTTPQIDIFKQLIVYGAKVKRQDDFRPAVMMFQKRVEKAMIFCYNIR